MKRNKIASREEVLILQAALTSTMNFLKEHNIQEHSETGQLLTDFQNELTNSIIDVLPGFDNK